jgi:hypothetical protein
VRTARRKAPQHPGTHMKRKDYLFVVLSPSPMLLIALLGNTFVEGWNWNPGAFVLLWAVLAIAALVYKLIATSPDAAPAHRLAAALAVLTGFVIFWMSIGPKIIGEEHPGNLLYLLAILLGLIGVGFSRLQPARLAKVAFGMAVALLIIPIVAVLLWPSNFGHGYPKVQLLSSVFAAMFTASGLLFRRTALRASP